MRPRSAPHDAPRGHLRRTHLIAVAIPALVALAVGLPTAAQASNGQCSSPGQCASPGKSDDHKPAGVGGGRRVR